MYTPHTCEGERIRPALRVYGTPGILYARYRCVHCGAEWDDPTEMPDSWQIWGVAEGA